MTVLRDTSHGLHPSIKPEVLNTLMNAKTSLGDGSIIDLGMTCQQHTCICQLAGAIPSAVVVRLKGSIDGSAFIDLAEYTITTTEKVTNGTFTGNANSWTAGAGWAYGTNNVGKTAGAGTLVQAIADMVSVPIIGENYLLNFTLSGWSAGLPSATYAGSTFVLNASTGADALFRGTITAASAAGALTFTPSASGDTYTIDSISLVRNEDGFHVTQKPVRYIKGCIVSVTGGGATTAVTMKCMSGGN